MLRFTFHTKPGEGAPGGPGGPPDVFDDVLFLRSLRGATALSQLYEFELGLECAGGDVVDPARLLGRAVVVRCEETLGSVTDAAFGVLSGVIRAVELQPFVVGTRARYRAWVVPRVWRLTRTLRSRVFVPGSFATATAQAPTVVEIVRRVLTSAGFIEEEVRDGRRGRHGDFRFDLAPSTVRRARAYTAQYNESDWAFVCRLLEDEGLCYFFESGGGWHERLVVTDGGHGFQPFGETGEPESAVFGLFEPEVDGVLPFVPVVGVSAEGQAVHAVARRVEEVPRTFFVRDWHPSSPTAAVSNASPVDALGEATATVEEPVVVRYGEGLDGAAHAGRVAALRAREAAEARDVYTMTTTVAALRAGHCFDLRGHFLNGASPGHPWAGASLDRRYLAVRVEHELLQRRGGDAGEPERYRNTATARAGTHAWVPPRVTPKPVLAGLFPAVIDGTAAPAAGTPAAPRPVVAPVDAQGRYHVVLPFDVTAVTGQRRGSCPIPMAQPLGGVAAAGAVAGVHFPLYEGATVLVGHVHGDPDRPVIVGALPGAGLRSPVTVTNDSQGVIQTRGGVRVVYDDDVPVDPPPPATTTT